jgi:hypothetical protein
MGEGPTPRARRPSLQVSARERPLAYRRPAQLRGQCRVLA